MDIAIIADGTALDALARRRTDRSVSLRITPLVVDPEHPVIEDRITGIALFIGSLSGAVIYLAIQRRRALHPPPPPPPPPLLPPPPEVPPWCTEGWFPGPENVWGWEPMALWKLYDGRHDFRHRVGRGPETNRMEMRMVDQVSVSCLASVFSMRWTSGIPGVVDLRFYIRDGHGVDGFWDESNVCDATRTTIQERVLVLGPEEGFKVQFKSAHQPSPDRPDLFKANLHKRVASRLVPYDQNDFDLLLIWDEQRPGNIILIPMGVLVERNLVRVGGQVTGGETFICVSNSEAGWCVQGGHFLERSAM